MRERQDDPQIMQGQLRPTKILATPTMLPLAQRDQAVARFLGPKGLMPSVRRGTVGTNIQRIIESSKGGTDWKGDPAGIVRACARAFSLSIQRGRSHN